MYAVLSSMYHTFSGRLNPGGKTCLALMLILAVEINRLTADSVVSSVSSAQKALGKVPSRILGTPGIKLCYLAVAKHTMVKLAASPRHDEDIP